MTIPAADQAQNLDDLMEKAQEAVAGAQYFQAERLANTALQIARSQHDFDRMARIVGPLREARRQRLGQALGVATITVLDTPITEQMPIDPGCYLVQPPRVGAEARRFRQAALSRDVPVAVLCREPLTAALGLCPIVAICSSTTVRTTVDPPADPENPDLAWFVEGLEALGDWAIESIDPEMAIDRRIDAILGRLDAVLDHDRLHQCLHEACRKAHQLLSSEHPTPGSLTAKTKVKP